MLAVRKSSAAPGVELEQITKPVPSAGEVLIEVAAVGICGSDLHIAEWEPAYSWLTALLPVTLGHEFSGVIREIGPGVEGMRVGQRVVVNPALYCDGCASCTSGHPDGCTAKSGIGMSDRGAMTRFVCAMARNCHVIPDTLDLVTAALAEPRCVGARAVAVGEVQAGQKVVVLGAGMVGVAIALMAQRVGAEVIIVGLNDDARLGAARQAGIPHTIDLKVTPLRDGESRIFPEGPDVVFEASGAAQSITDGLDVLRAGGILVAAGIHSHNIEIDFTQLVRRKLQVRGSHAWLDADWHTVMSFLSESPHIAEALISDRFALEEAHAAFDAAKGRSGLKVMLLPSDTID